MKYSELYRLLSSAGCYIVRHGKCHDLWVNPKNTSDKPCGEASKAGSPKRDRAKHQEETFNLTQ